MTVLRGRLTSIWDLFVCLFVCFINWQWRTLVPQTYFCFINWQWRTLVPQSSFCFINWQWRLLVPETSVPFINWQSFSPEAGVLSLFDLQRRLKIIYYAYFLLFAIFPRNRMKPSDTRHLVMSQPISHQNLHTRSTLLR